MHYNFCFSQVLSIIGNEKVRGKKVNCYGRSDTETILVDQTCSTANAPFSSCSQPRRTCVLCTDSLTRTQNAISQLKCLCHLDSYLNLISFFLNAGGQIEVNAKRKETRMYRKETVTCELGWSSLKPATIRRSRAPQHTSYLASLHLNDSVVFHWNRQVAVLRFDGERCVSSAHDPTCCPPQVGSAQPCP